LTWIVYIVRCADGTLYTGITNDLARRIAMHDAGRGARYTRGRGPVVVVHTESCGSKGEALRREAALRRLRPAEKLRLAAARGTGGA
jgi:putative endonuclease